MPAKTNNSTVKASVKKRTDNTNRSKANKATQSGASFNELDPKRRLGNFSGAGEHPLIGGRNTGIVGGSKKKKFKPREAVPREK